jgi:EAL domain-containing protein (putative c-di-GMP-specific phosphodiesterase class I)
MHHSHEDGSVYRVEECPVYGALRGETCHVTTEVFWRRDGTHFAVDYTSAPIREQGRIVGAVCCFADITAARQRERDLQERVRFGDEIHRALQEERFVLHGQPISPAADPQRPVRHELLIRMKDLARPDVLRGPGEFLPQAERYGLINQIDRWVISKALEVAGRRPVSLNLSAKSVAEPEIADLILAGVQERAIPRGNLMLEITETTALEDLTAAHRFIQRLTDIGCGIALDDFGTGYGTLAHLKELPVSHLKIDMGFVRNLTESTEDERVVRSIVSLARNFGMKTIAEGVETAAAMELLQRLGVDYLQGYHLGRPLPLERD